MYQKPNLGIKLSKIFCLSKVILKEQFCWPYLLYTPLREFSVYYLHFFPYRTQQHRSYFLQNLCLYIMDSTDSCLLCVSYKQEINVCDPGKKHCLQLYSSSTKYSPYTGTNSLYSLDTWQKGSSTTPLLCSCKITTPLLKIQK